MTRFALPLVLALSACAGGDHEWTPTPGATLKIGQEVTSAKPLPSECGDFANYESDHHFEVIALTPSMVTIRDRLLVANRFTVLHRCVVPYVYR